MSILAESSLSLLKKWLRTELPLAAKDVEVQYLANAVHIMARNNPEDALKFYSSIADTSVIQESAIDSIFSKLAEKSVDRALTLAREKLEGEALDSALFSIMIEGEPNEKDFEIAKEIADKQVRNLALSELSYSEYLRDPSGAKSRLSQFSDSEIRALILTSPTNDDSLVQTIGRREPEFLLSLFERITLTNQSAQALDATVSLLAQDKPELAQKLIDSVPEGPLKIQLLGKKYGKIAASDSDAAMVAASRLSNINEKDEVYKSIGSTIGNQSLETALLRAKQ
jgi:hypothetical protein